LRQLLRRFLDVCNAIDYAHSRGVIHRDIKPAKIIVGKHGETLVVDWGLAKPMGRALPGIESGERLLMPSSASGSSETLPGSTLGTPAYMSPEQAEGQLERLGPRSDVYSLGATLYCLLTGQPPFAGDVVDVIRAVQKGGFRPPRQLDHGIDPALAAICLKAMATRIEDRYSTATAPAHDVERWMADERVAALSHDEPARGGAGETSKVRRGRAALDRWLRRPRDARRPDPGPSEAEGTDRGGGAVDPLLRGLGQARGNSPLARETQAGGGPGHAGAITTGRPPASRAIG